MTNLASAKRVLAWTITISVSCLPSGVAVWLASDSNRVLVLAGLVSGVLLIWQVSSFHPDTWETITGVPRRDN